VFLTVYLVLALHKFSGWFILIPAAAYLGFVIYSQRVYPREQPALRAVGFYERGLARLAGKWIGIGDSGASFTEESSLYTNDLDIFGTGSLFELLCTARTHAGQKILAEWLSKPAARADMRG